MLTKVVTKIMPTPNQIGIHLLLQDDNHPITAGTVTVIDEDFTENYSAGQGMSDAVRNAVGKKAQEAIDEYIANKKLYNKTAYGTAVTQISNALVLTE
jgi:hypothetical protein